MRRSLDTGVGHKEVSIFTSGLTERCFRLSERSQQEREGKDFEAKWDRSFEAGSSARGGGCYWWLQVGGFSEGTLLPSETGGKGGRMVKMPRSPAAPKIPLTSFV